MPPFREFFQAATLAVIGGGGKTGLIGRVADELAEAGQAALVTVTTRLGREQLSQLERVEAENLEEVLYTARRAAAGERLLLAGPRRADSAAENKLEGLPAVYFQPLRRAFPALPLLIEADGSKGRPLKVHAPHEPVLPPLDFFLVAVLGLSSLTRPPAEAVHRPDLYFGERARTAKPLEPMEVAEFIGRAWAPLKPDLIFLNQADAPERRSLGRQLAELLLRAPWRVAWGSVYDNWMEFIS